MTAGLKNLKVTDKEQKKKAIQMVKDHQEEMEDLFMNGADLTEERLEELLKTIEEEGVPTLTPKEEMLFERYRQKISQE